MQPVRFHRYIIFLLTALYFAGCAPTTVTQLENKHDAAQLPPEKILQLVEGNTMLFESVDEDVYLYFDKSGRVYGIDNDHNKDIGKWDVSNQGELCIKMQFWWVRDLKCLYVYTADDNKYSLTNSSGVITYTASLFTGDSKNLYYEPQETRKSYRKSIRSQAANEESKSEAQQETVDANDTGGIEAPVQKSTYPASDAEIKSTVKWMAKDCPGCNLANANLKKADLVGAKLQGANLSGADLSMADMRRADLEGAILEDANLTYANMPGANLRNCNLKRANLKGANLIRADLTGADIDGAILEDTLLEGAQGIR